MSCKVYKGSEVATGPMPWLQTGAVTACPEVQEPKQRNAELDRQLELRLKTAYEKGLAEGEAQGRRRSAAEVQAALQRLAHSIEELARLRPALRAEAESELVHMAVAIARRILRREIGTDPDALRGLVAAALEKLQIQEVTRARVHPSQAAALASFLQGASASKVEVVAEPTLEPGALIFETSRGDLDASVDSQLNEIERGLADCLRRRN
jgi:flagellar assembly protein FliH